MDGENKKGGGRLSRAGRIYRRSREGKGGWMDGENKHNPSRIAPAPANHIHDHHHHQQQPFNQSIT